MKKIAIVFLALGFLAGCATCPVSKENSSQKKEDIYEKYIKDNNLEEVHDITAFRLESWSFLDAEHLILVSSPRSPYLITLQLPCNYLQNAVAIAIKGDKDRVEAGFDSIFVREYPDQIFAIKSIHRLTEDLSKELVKISKDESKNCK